MRPLVFILVWTSAEREIPDRSLLTISSRATYKIGNPRKLPHGIEPTCWMDVRREWDEKKRKDACPAPSTSSDHLVAIYFLSPIFLRFKHLRWRLNIRPRSNWTVCMTLGEVQPKETRVFRCLWRDRRPLLTEINRAEYGDGRSTSLIKGCSLCCCDAIYRRVLHFVYNMNHIPPYSFRSRMGEDEVRDIRKHDFRSVLLYFSSNANQAKQRVTTKICPHCYSGNHSGDGLTRFQTRSLPSFAANWNQADSHKYYP